MRRLNCLFVALLVLVLPLSTRASTFVTYVTGEIGAADQIFRVVLDPAVEAATITPFIGTALRVDGIDFLPGGLKLVVGAQGGAGGGAIEQYSIATAAIVLPDLVPNTGIGAPSGTSQPSSVLTHGAHVYYTENQFGFGGPDHRIMRTPIAGPSGTTELVYAGVLPMGGGLINYEGLLIEGGFLYFFAADPGGPPLSRFMYRIALTPAGLWDGTPPTALVGPTPAGAPGDGADEFTIDPFNRIVFGSNIVNGEIVAYDIPAATGGLLFPPGPYPPGSKRELLTTMAPDGIRFAEGWLVLTGLGGVIASVNVAGLGDGPDEVDVRIQYEDSVEGNDYAFDDMTPLHFVTPTPTFPGSFSLWLALGCLGAVGGALLAARGRAARA